MHGSRRSCCTLRRLCTRLALLQAELQVVLQELEQQQQQEQQQVQQAQLEGQEQQEVQEALEAEEAAAEQAAALWAGLLPGELACSSRLSRRSRLTLPCSWQRSSRRCCSSRCSSSSKQQWRLALILQLQLQQLQLRLWQQLQLQPPLCLCLLPQAGQLLLSAAPVRSQSQRRSSLMQRWWLCTAPLTVCSRRALQQL